LESTRTLEINFISNVFVLNKVRKLMRVKLRDEQDEVARSSKSNPKKFWNYVKSKTKIHEQVSDLVYETDSGVERLTCRDSEKATVL